MSYLLALVAATALSPQSAQDIRCVALLGIVAYEQGRDSAWRDLPPIRSDGERFAGIVGERVMTETGQTREAVTALILADVAALQKAKSLAPDAVESCLTRVAVVAPPPPPPELPRCAAIMAVAAETEKARAGLSKGAKDLATLASILAYRAQVEGVAAGKTEVQVADAIAAGRATAVKAGSTNDDELRSCADLAAAD